MSEIVQTELAEKAVVTSQVQWRDYLKNENYSESIDTMCDDCRSHQLAQHGEIHISCDGLANIDNIIPKDLKVYFSDAELSRISEIADPYEWAMSNVEGLQMRWYQEMMVRCTAKRRAYRCGRRSGKTFSFALNILHRLLTNKGYRVLICTPYEIQAEELVNTIRELIYKLKPEYGSYKELVYKDVKSPSYFLQFTNRSRLRALTTGSSGAGSTRGQAADLIVLDEVDYMTDADIDSISAILADNQDTEMWMASTPTGKKGRFYDRCHDKKFKEFHFPSYVLPHYNDSLDDDFRSQLTDIGYVHEVLAEFGESEKGVFQKTHIESSTLDNVDFKHAAQFREQYVLALGCDWNDDKVGTRLQVVAFHKNTGKFKIIERETVSKEGWTQVAAVQKIVDMNRKWNLDFIYVDEGFGVSTVQFIKKYAYEQFGKLPEGHPDLNLANVVGINFSSKIEVRDLITSEISKKDMKVYMVENCVRMLEKGAIIFDTEQDRELRKQMNNYIILRRSPTGKPVYGTEEDSVGDHDLDAFMLAMLSFSMEMSSFIGEVEYAPIVANVNRTKEMFDGDGYVVEHEKNPIPLFASKNKVKGDSFYKKRIHHTGRAGFSIQKAGNSPRFSNTISGKDGVRVKRSSQDLFRTGSRRASF